MKLLNVSHHEIVNAWQPYVISVLIYVVMWFVIIMGLKASFKTGIGHLYGPLFFIPILRPIPFGYYKEYVQLKFTISIFQLLNLEIFGEIQWCFFCNINPVLNYFLHFVGPFIIAAVLLSTVLLARYYPIQFLSQQSSPVQDICLLILLSFWSVTDTCIQLLHGYFQQFFSYFYLALSFYCSFCHHF